LIQLPLLHSVSVLLLSTQRCSTGSAQHPVCCRAGQPVRACHAVGALGAPIRPASSTHLLQSGEPASAAAEGAGWGSDGAGGAVGVAPGGRPAAAAASAAAVAADDEEEKIDFGAKKATWRLQCTIAGTHVRHFTVHLREI